MPRVQMLQRLRGHDIWWWSRLAAVFAAIEVYIAAVPHPHGWGGWVAYDAAGVAVGAAAGLLHALFEVWQRGKRSS